MRRWIGSLALLGAASFGMASSEFLDAFMANYKVKEGSAIAEKSCGICHVSDSDFGFNPFGSEIKKAIAETGQTEISAKVWTAIALLDSDGDGNPNDKEIESDTLPGDPASGAAEGVTPKPLPTPEPKKPAQFPPKNGFHPAIVHFPIALFIGGVLLDLLGLIRKDKTMLHAGWYCTVMAAVTTLGAILSGVLAMTLQKLPYRGLILSHVQYAAATTVLLWILVVLRVHRHEKMNVPLRVAYYVISGLCFLLISWAGHLGGVFVYGE